MQTAQEMTCTLQKQGEVICLTPYTQEEHHFKQFPTPPVPKSWSCPRGCQAGEGNRSN